MMDPDGSSAPAPPPATRRKRSPATRPQTGKKAEELQLFLLKLSDAIRPLADPLRIQEVASQVVGEHLGNVRAGYAEIDGEDYIVRLDRPGKPGVGRFPLLSYGRRLLEDSRRHNEVSVSDVENDPRFTEEERASYQARDIRSLAAVMFKKNDHWVGVFGVQSSEPRAWRREELQLLREAGERTWAAMEQAKAEAALRESENEYRTLFQSLDEGFCLIELMFDESGQPVDHRFLQVNASFERLTGIHDAVGRQLTEVVPDFQDNWLRAYEQVVKTRQPIRFETLAGEGDLWYEIYAFPVQEPERMRVGVLFNDVTSRKRREENLQLLGDLTSLFDFAARWQDLMPEIGRRIQAHFRFSSLKMIEFRNRPGGQVVSLFNSRNTETVSETGPCRLHEYFNVAHLEQLAAGSVVAIGDVTTADIREGGAAFAEHGVSSILSAPYVSEDRLRFLIGGIRKGVSAWRSDEIDLIRELAAQIWLRIERAKAQEALKNSEQRLRIALDSGRMGTWDWTVADNLVRWNDRHFELLGMTPDGRQLTADDFMERVHPDDREVVATELDRAVSAAGDYHAEFRIVRADNGLARWVTAFGRTSEQSDGRATRMIGVIYDSHEKQTAAEALQQAHDELESRVTERTRDLKETLEKLRCESAARKEIECERAELLERLVKSQEEERRRISRDLHDNLGQHMVAVMMALETLQRNETADSAGYDKLRELVEKFSTAVRRQAWELRPAELDHLGLEAALHHYVSDWSSQTGVRAEFLTRGPDDSRPGSDGEIALYRVTQEALTNVARHASTRAVTVTLEFGGGTARVTIRDDGRGFDLPAAKGRLGLVGMRERISQVGGTLHIRTKPGGGTEIRATAPYSRDS